MNKYLLLFLIVSIFRECISVISFSALKKVPFLDLFYIIATFWLILDGNTYHLLVGTTIVLLGIVEYCMDDFKYHSYYIKADSFVCAVLMIGLVFPQLGVLVLWKNLINFLN
jgi:hypothetical protein